MAAHSPSTVALQTLQSQTPHTRRIRPPDMGSVTADENRVPLRQDKLGRRESRLGLRGLFGRSKPPKDLADGPSFQRDLNRPGGIRASLAEISNWPHTLTSRPDDTLPTIPSRSPSLTLNSPIPNHANIVKKPAVVPSPRQKGSPTPARSTRGSLATWDPPPLFQAYPQAIKHIQLTTPALSPDVILRMGDKKPLRDDLSSPIPPTAGESAQDAPSPSAERKKKHRRDTSASSAKFEWTSKIYVLVTSGYLLQYSTEGSFDRLPEKMLHLGKDSAAFASDVIPGRHWVLQVSSVMDADGTATTTDSRSFFRLPFRAGERRNASNFLLVFEGAVDMESWITVLRREIEALGGKKNLSETGKPKSDDHILQLRAQPSQRTLVVRDPDRFSRFIPDASWQPPQGRPSEDCDRSVTVVDTETAQDQSPDDRSTTNSIISQDGRQLDNLRDSSHRLSYLSSGQRTIITSAGSSPACSPTRDSFASAFDDAPYREPTQEVRPRPNAAAINDRRQSMQMVNPLVDFRMQHPPRPHSTYGGVASSSTLAPSDLDIPAYAVGPTTVNFSVPHSVSRRYSLVKLSSMDSPHPGLYPPQPFKDRELPPRVTRRMPPSSLPISRPLSIVADHPSPVTECGSATRPSTRHSEVVTPVELLDPSPITSLFRDDHGPSHTQHSRHSTIDVTGRDLTSELHAEAQATNPRRCNSMYTLRNSLDMGRMPSPPPASGEQEAYPPRSRSSAAQPAHSGRPRSRSPPVRDRRQMNPKGLPWSDIESWVPRVSFTPAAVDDSPTGTPALPRPLPSGPPGKLGATAPPASSLGLSLTPVAGAIQSNGYLDLNVDSKMLPNRRSMSQLVEIPPPVPPPTCALPPIPQKIRARN